MSVFIGTSGFMYPHWQGHFYPSKLPQKDWFGYYTKQFDTVELNVSFYRLPKKKTFADWRRKTGQNFTFSIKGSRYITHVKRLRDGQEAVKRFFEAAAAVKNDKEVVLWQLPPRMKANKDRLERFLEVLPQGWRHAFEFRHESWLDKEIEAILKKYQVAVVFQDFPDWPMSEKVTADFVYLRFHGRTRLYTSNYSNQELKNQGRKINRWLKKGLDVYAYFNNDALGYAVENAKALKGFVSGR
jgi:uncharacterized protein YecE (DUF72 family)